MATAFAIYSEDDFSLDFYNRDVIPSVGDTFENKVATKVYTNISASTPAWKSDGNVKKIISSTVVDIVSPTKCANWYNGAALLTTLNLTNLDTSNVTDTNYMFGGCTSLETIDVGNFNMSKVTNMRCMFYNCTNLQEIDVSNFDVSSVTNFEYVFYACLQANIIGIENWNTSKGTSMMSMFYKCASVPHFDLSRWDTSNVTNMSWMFNRTAGTIDFTGWNTSKVTTFKGMFAASFITYLDLSSFDVSAATNLNSMFFDSTSLRAIEVSYNWNETFQSNVDTAWMFENCFALMGDISYSDMNDIAEPENYEHMTGIYATTHGGYLTMKHEESEDDEGEDVTNNNVYMVHGITLSNIANTIRKITGIPTKIALNNFNKMLDKQVGSVKYAKIIVKDRRYIADDVTNVGNVYYINTSFVSTYKGISRFVVIPDIIQGSVLHLENMLSLEDGLGTLICKGDITKLADTTFLVNGDGSIELVLTSSLDSEPMMMSMRRMTPASRVQNTERRVVEDADE